MAHRKSCMYIFISGVDIHTQIVEFMTSVLKSVEINKN